MRQYNLDPRGYLASRLRKVLTAALSLSLVSACSGGGEPTEPTDPTGLTIVDGNSQLGTAGEPLEEPLVVRLTTDDGEPIEGVAVAWSVITGGGTIDPETSRTDADGEAETEWTLGDELGEQTVIATSGGLTAVYRATAVDSRTPAAVITVAGDGQIGVAGGQLLNPLVVRVENQFGRPVAGVQVVWTVDGGGGFITPTATTTNTDGLAQVTWTLGHTSTAQSAFADVAGIPARFTATAGR